MHRGAGDHLLHLTEELVGVIQAGKAAERRNEIYGQNGVEVDGAKAVHGLEKQIEEKPDIVFQIEPFTPAEPGFQAVLTERMLRENRGVLLAAADKGDGMPGAGQRSADPDHPLVKDKIVGDGEKKTHKPANIRELRGYTHDYYSIFGPNF
jgi:hypothetical protein